MNNTDLFRPGHNCWRTEKATHASLVVDCANYYRNLYESIMKARHSVFVTGWDIDSRVELLRGDYVKDPNGPKNLYELLTMKAGENPDLKIYLNRWDYSLLMAQSREPMGVFKWRGAQLDNIYFCRDDMVPFGACHHQKVIVVDDEVAYMGGMDIALLRWDTREHFPDQEYRIDPGGVYNPHGHTPYGPYHDIMTVVSGPAATALAELSRERWKIATGYDPVPLRVPETNALPQAWPDSDGVDFENIDVAIARTIPPMEVHEKEFYIEQMYLDEIARAEHFIYMENQYFTRDSIAEALNKRLREVPDLKAVLVSSYDPQGKIEEKVLWTGRIKFYCKIRTDVEDRVIMVYPAAEVHGHKATVRIHSKFMIVDDKFLHVGSANINNRSMRVDTEVDMVYAATTDAHREKIRAIRNDLIKEHSGRDPEETEAIISGASIHPLASRVSYSRQFFEEVKDEDFCDQASVDHPLTNLAVVLGDPDGDVLPEITILPRRHADIRRFPLQKTIFTILLIALIGGLVSLWKFTPLGDLITPDRIEAAVNELRQSPGSTIYTTICYILALMAFVPAAPLTLGVAAAFGPKIGFTIAIIGAMVAALGGFLLGRIVNPGYLGIMIGTAIERVRQQVKDASIPAITFLRLLPIAPFNAVNLALGIVKLRLDVFIIGTLLGFLPGTAILAFMGDSLFRVMREGNGEGYLALGLGVLAYLAVVGLTHFAYKRWEKTQNQDQAKP